MQQRRFIREKLFNWELWPFALRYAPLGPLWLWYIIKARSLWFFTPADPTITFGGFDGEGKKEMYDLLPESTYPETIYIKPGMPVADVKKLITQHRFSYPFCVKPDCGLKGLLFRKVDDEEKLDYYHRHVTVDYLIQELVDLPLEVSVFYYRHPGTQKGVISGFIQKEMMHVYGDGSSTLWTLIQQHEKARYRLEEMRIKHQKQLATVIPDGEKYILTHAANLNRGARFTNLAGEIDEQLHSIFDALSHHCFFYYGRYDIKCNSIEELKRGRFVILEFNGTGAEPNHVYNAGFSWIKALSVIAHHWNVMYKIGRYNYKHKGIRYWGNREGLRFLRKAQQHAVALEKMDKEILI